MSGKKILIVEDDKDLILGMSIRLKSIGYSVVTAMDGLSVISTARKEHPDLILLDIGLPAGDGFIVLERLRTNTMLMAIPVIVISARDKAANSERSLKAGARAYFQKPVDNETLLRAIKTTLDNPE
ncbi:MAG: response regulator [Thermodesulfobacteriota bacterium]